MHSHLKILFHKTANLLLDARLYFVPLVAKYVIPRYHVNYNVFMRILKRKLDDLSFPTQ